MKAFTHTEENDKGRIESCLPLDIDIVISIAIYMKVKNAEIPHHTLIADKFGTKKAKAK